MKKYLTLAAILGAIAFLSVSYLAQANDKMEAAVTTTTTATVPAAPTAPAAATPFALDSDMCTMLASAPTTEGAAPSDEVKAAAFKKCMIGKGHTEEELKKAEDAKKAEAPKAEAAPAAK